MGLEEGSMVSIGGFPARVAKVEENDLGRITTFVIDPTRYRVVADYGDRTEVIESNLCYEDANTLVMVASAEIDKPQDHDLPTVIMERE